MDTQVLSPTGDELNKASFVCEVAGCGKQFKRSDHLLRHKRNHESISLFSCSWPGCEKSFVRKDVRLKHYKRHVQKEKEKSGVSGNKIKHFEIYTPKTVMEKSKPIKGEDLYKSNGQDKRAVVSTESNTPINMLHGSSGDDGYSFEDQTPQEKSNINYVMNSDDNLIADLVPSPTINFEQTNLEKTGLLEWLLHNNEENSHKYLNYSPSSSFKDLLGDTPDLTYSTSQTSISNATIRKMAELVPSLMTDSYFTAENIEKYLVNFWCIYHIQFPIIHRPTFSTTTANPLLLLSIMTIGSSLESRMCHEPERKLRYIKLAESIADPLRWLICSHGEVLESSTSWLLQSLLILECYEITCSNRKLHRRAHLNHGFKIELLRRSPLLGGNLEQSDDLDKDASTSPWESWIELESLKRCAYITFLVDTYNAIIFGQEAVLYTHHIKLSLPCIDSIWEAANTNKMDVNNQLDNSKFLSVLTDVLRYEKVNSTPFTSRILLVGIISLAVQTEQIDLSVKALQDQGLKSWKTSLLQSLDSWYDNVIDETCCELDSAFYCPIDIPEAGLSKPDDTSCKFAVYHIAQAFLRVPQYDCIIFAGSPQRMNIKTSPKDLENVRRRMENWTKSLDGRMAVTHAYVLLCEILLTQDETGEHVPVTYEPNMDPIFYRPNIVASSLFLIWCYNYCLSGAESNYLKRSDPMQNSSYIPERINGYQYVRNVKKKFEEEARIAGVDSSSKKFTAYANALQNINRLHCTVGLLRLFKDKFIACNSQICREYGRLMENCIQRSLGRESVICPDMYVDA
ncbi:hypothetical protein PSN45_000753 [Yamadazyma tenuis]|uniref:C2H2-type domain-containing protein n=1 Tax=Candida tenuis (strain ATCC 10573 / BCRC 21748 / CBS 615 / JCM 9827 / NBRC 10315 / NRRL Y-1498 / VKM Y-70) TaxID=590646 RepID=G3BAE8_CANTC|nr:uncharacterized protein CANTEDRAFT_108704 [Yamadazyma tenuis ATCC 10573]EGV62044.1 hypothetical protein CANTEDRAFT_108704 [Yamadazyma tenuis ATCC 10573]WEJ93290.1 hypothetical protein PSN45_000753 [Yamadazyma tenuis]